ncbi:cell wall glucanase protein [Rutstroemia sp. NJR-2017a WRK4]|nr:cell wall glucanase protein [Rutstroemia sp. NJR-2017a WRK4]
MKAAILSLAGLSLLQLSLAQPFNRHNHRALHKKRDLVTVIDTVYVEATETPEVIIYVNTAGVPLSTTTQTIHGGAITSSSATTVSNAAAATVVAAQPSSSSSSSEAAAGAAVYVQSSVQAVASVASSATSTAVAYSAPSSVASSAAAVVPVASSAAPVSSVVPSSSASVVQSSSTSSAASSATSVAATSGGWGFAYSPYMADSSCKTQAQVNADFAAIPSGYSTVRLYGVDCNQITTGIVAAKKYGFKIFAGLYNYGSVSADAQTLITAVNGDWSTISTIAVGNEWVNNGVTDPAGVATAVSTVKGLLKAAGYTGKLVSVDTLAATKQYPALCNNADIDFCAVNCHPFFDTNTDAASAGSFITTQITELRALLSNPNMEIVITETGWPSSGTSHDKAVVSKDAQTTAIAAIKSAFSSNQSNLFLFSTFNDYWKVNSAALYNAEQAWGYLGNAPSDIAAGLVSA